MENILNKEGEKKKCETIKHFIVILIVVYLCVMACEIRYLVEIGMAYIFNRIFCTGNSILFTEASRLRTVIRPTKWSIVIMSYTIHFCDPQLRSFYIILSLLFRI